MIKSKRYVEPKEALIRLLIVSLIAVSIAFFTSVYQAQAEGKINLTVIPYGSIGTALTSGWTPSAGIRAAYSSSTTTRTVYYLNTEMRFWHNGNRDYRDISSCYNCSGATVPTYSTAVWGTHAARHIFYGQSSYGHTHYTSDHGGLSCYTYWGTGYNSC